MIIYHLKIKLADITPAIWRSVEVPGNYTLNNLHDIIQIIMGWEDRHLHEFFIDKNRYEATDPEMQFLDDAKYTLEQVLGDHTKNFLYTYDFGDSWDHEITVTGTSTPDEDSSYPICVKGKRACPPEDCGGTPGYYNILDALKNPSEDNEHVLEWIGNWDPEKFNINSINKKLANLSNRLERKNNT